MRSALPLLLIPALAAPAFASDEGIPIRPGEWHLTTRTTVSGAPGAQEQEDTGCFERDTLTADGLTLRSVMCTNEEVEVADRVMTWKVFCYGQMRGNSGVGRVAMQDETFDGTLELYGIPRADGTRMVVTTTWKGKRLGECSESEGAAQPPSP